MTRNYDIADAENVPMIKNRLGRESLHSIKKLMTEEKEMCKISIRLFQMPNEKFKPNHNEIILSFQDCKLFQVVMKTTKTR